MMSDWHIDVWVWILYKPLQFWTFPTLNCFICLAKCTKILLYHVLLYLKMVLRLFFLKLGLVVNLKVSLPSFCIFFIFQSLSSVIEPHLHFRVVSWLDICSSLNQILMILGWAVGVVYRQSMVRKNNHINYNGPQ